MFAPRCVFQIQLELPPPSGEEAFLRGQSEAAVMSPSTSPSCLLFAAAT